MQYLQFRSGCAKYRDLVELVGYLGTSDPFDPPSHVVVFDEASLSKNSDPWGVESVDHVLVDVTAFKPINSERPIFVCLSEEGEVLFHDWSVTTESITEAGLWKSGSMGFGYLECIRQLGNDLFAGGFAGQLYQRIAPNEWIRFDGGLFEQTEEKFDVSDICISSKGQYYAITTLGKSGRILVREDNSDWTDIVNPSGEWLKGCVAAEDGTVWICGKNGTLLHGNAQTGFKAVPTPDTNDTFLSVALYAGRVWVATNVSLFVYDGDTMTEVETGLSPRLRSANRLQAVDGVLWSFGYDDIVRFDGAKWERFICPAAKPFE
jgi:hypothetical protein